MQNGPSSSSSLYVCAYMVKLEFNVIYIIFLIYAQRHTPSMF